MEILFTTLGYLPGSGSLILLGSISLTAALILRGVLTAFEQARRPESKSNPQPKRGLAD
jgi:hypothetical protein